MTIDELISELTECRERNREPSVPDYDPGTIEVHVQSDEGTFDSKILSVDLVGSVWLVVNEPSYDDY